MSGQGSPDAPCIFQVHSHSPADSFSVALHCSFSQNVLPKRKKRSLPQPTKSNQLYRVILDLKVPSMCLPTVEIIGQWSSTISAAAPVRLRSKTRTQYSLTYGRDAKQGSQRRRETPERISAVPRMEPATEIHHRPSRRSFKQPRTQLQVPRSRSHPRYSTRYVDLSRCDSPFSRNSMQRSPRAAPSPVGVRSEPNAARRRSPIGKEWTVLSSRSDGQQAKQEARRFDHQPIMAGGNQRQVSLTPAKTSLETCINHKDINASASLCRGPIIGQPVPHPLLAECGKLTRQSQEEKNRCCRNEVNPQEQTSNKPHAVCATRTARG